MPTPTKGARMGGSPAHQKHMLANLATSLFEHGKITTTEARARRLRPYAEKLITLAKRGDLHARRQVETVITPNRRVDGTGDRIVHNLFAEIGPAMADRPGGYTRITKIGPPQGRRRPDGGHRAGQGRGWREQAAPPHPPSGRRPGRAAAAARQTVEETTDSAAEAEDTEAPEAEDTEPPRTRPRPRRPRLRTMRLRPTPRRAGGLTASALTTRKLRTGSSPSVGCPFSRTGAGQLISHHGEPGWPPDAPLRPRPRSESVARRLAGRAGADRCTAGANARR